MIQHILFPVDFSRQSEGAARWVRAYADRFGAAVTLIHAANTIDAVLGFGDFGAYTGEDIRRAQLEHASRKLAQFQTAEFPSAARIVADGDPALKIVEQSDREKSALIMMPTHGLGPFRRYLIGSTTAKVLHDAHCAVWTGVHLEKTPGHLDPHSLDTVLCGLDVTPSAAATLKWAALFASQARSRLILVHARPPVAQDLAREAGQRIAAIRDAGGIEASIVTLEGEPAQVLASAAGKEKAGLVIIGRGSAAGGSGRLRAHAYSIIRNSCCPVISV